MKIIPFETKYLSVIQSWLKAREMNDKLTDNLPTHGWVSFEHETPVAMGFLRCIEGDMAMIDSLITNPEINPKSRNMHLTKLNQKLIKVAKHHKLKALIAATIDYHTLIRALELGFVQQSHTLISLDLSKGV